MSTTGDIVYKTSRPIAKLTGEGISLGAKHLYNWFGMPLAIGALAAVTQWDHAHEVESIKDEYQKEIGARIGKNPALVTLSDLDQVAKENPTLAEALKRSRWRRNLNIAVITVSMVTAFALATTLGPLIAASWIGSLIVTGAISFVTFMASEYVLHKYGNERLGLNEPDLETVRNDPARQSELSLPQQVRYIEELQRTRAPVSQAQIMTLFVAADPALAATIEAQYGQPFASLSAQRQSEVIALKEPELNLAALTEDINQRLVRAQELAFRVQGQVSGVARTQRPHVTTMDQVNANLRQQLSVAQEKIGELGTQVKTQAARLNERAHDGARYAADKSRAALEGCKAKLGFAKSEVAMAVPQQQELLNASVPLGDHTARLTPPSATGSQVDQLVASRQTSQMLQPQAGV